MHVLVYLLEAALFVELSSYGVVLEYIELYDVVKAPGVVHQLTPESPAMILRVEENPPHSFPIKAMKPTTHPSCS